MHMFSSKKRPRIPLWKAFDIKAKRRYRWKVSVCVSLGVLAISLYMRLAASVWGWDSVLDWSVVSIPTIAGLAAWFIPVKEATAKHKWVLFVGGLALSALIAFQQHRTRKVHDREMGELRGDIARIPSAVASEMLKMNPKTTQAQQQTPTLPSANNHSANSNKNASVQQSTPPSQPDVSKGIEEIKSLIVGQKWGLNAEQLTVLTRRMIPYASSRERGDLITGVLGDSDSTKFAMNLVAAFRAAGWNIPGSGFNQAIFTGNPTGIIFKLHSRTSNPQGLQEIIATLREAGIEPTGEIDANVPEADFQIVVGRKP